MQETVDVGSINSFNGRLDKIRRTRMGFLWILYDLQSPRPLGDRTPVRPHKVSHKVSHNVFSPIMNHLFICTLYVVCL